MVQLRYNTAGAKRDLPVSDSLIKALTDGVTAVYGPDHSISIISAAQGEGSSGQTGSRRHNTHTAADVYVYDPSGAKLPPDALVPLAEHWLGAGVGSVGFPANGQSLHLDLIGGNGPGAVPLQKGEGRVWYYGQPSPTVRKALNASLTSGALPKYAISPEAVSRGLIPPAEIPQVASQIDIEAAKSAPLYRFDASGRPINTQTGQPVPSNDPAFGVLMAYRQQAAQAPAPAPVSKVAPVPASVEDRVTARNTAPVAAPGRAPTPATMPQKVATERSQNAVLGDRLAQADAEAAQPKSDPVGSMPAFSSLQGLGSGSNALSAKPPKADPIGAMPTMDEFKTVMKPVQVENPDYAAAMAQKAETPGGMSMNFGSRDAVAQRGAGQAFVATKMPPKWITQMKPVQVPVAQPAQPVQRNAPTGGVVPSFAANPAQQPALGTAAGYLYQPNALGGFQRVGRVNPALSPAATYAQHNSAARNPTNAAERMSSNSRRFDSDTPDSIAS